MDQVRVRMYRPGGIGDCFLLSFPREGGQSHMLIDCGVLTGTDDAARAMQAVVADVVQATGKRLDVLVATHEHWDHVSGFLQAKEQFEQITIGEVWLAWTEDRRCELANQLREKKDKAQKAVDSARQKLRLAAAPGSQAAIAALDSLSMFFGGFSATGGPTTAGAMKWAREETGAPVRYLSPGGEPHTIPGTEGVNVYVLGPPEDRRLLKRSDPSKRSPEVYHLAGGVEPSFMAALAELGDTDTGRPFDPSFEKPVEEAKEEEFFRTSYYSAEEWRKIELDWLGMAELLALRLDSDTNNTSLALAIELVNSGRVLLFPGDAQVGNWLSWEPLTWTLKEAGGERTVTTQDLLDRTVLYKVGHHGSHNATLREQGLELMQSTELAAMIPVYEEQARRQGKKGWAMPFGPLLTALEEKTLGRIIRADHGKPDNQAFGEPVYEEHARRRGKNGWAMPFGPLLKALRIKIFGRIIRADHGLPDNQAFAGPVTETDKYIDYKINL
jgi:hypothetical protein